MAPRRDDEGRGGRGDGPAGRTGGDAGEFRHGGPGGALASGADEGGAGGGGALGGGDLELLPGRAGAGPARSWERGKVLPTDEIEADELLADAPGGGGPRGPVTVEGGGSAGGAGGAGGVGGTQGGGRGWWSKEGRAPKEKRGVLVEEIEDLDADGEGGRGKKRKPLKDSRGRTVVVRGKRPILMALTVLAVVLLVSYVLYGLVIPRADLEVRTIYHEAPGGGGTSGVININVLLTNKGTVDLEELEVTIEVDDWEGEPVPLTTPEGSEVLRYNFTSSLVSGSQEQPRVKYRADQRSTYYIHVRVSFEAGGERYSGAFNYDTRGDIMNQEHVERITQWLP